MKESLATSNYFYIYKEHVATVQNNGKNKKRERHKSLSTHHTSKIAGDTTLYSSMTVINQCLLLIFSMLCKKIRLQPEIK